METQKYKYDINLVGSREELKAHDEHWYMQRLMTGAEAMNVFHIALRRYYNETKNEEFLWLSGSLINDYCLYYDWALAIEEMLDEKAAGEYLPGIPDWLEKKRYEPCKCCENCKYKD